MTPRWKVRGFLAAFALLCGGLAFAFWNVHEAFERERWVDHTDNVLTELGRLYSAIREADSSARGFALSGKDAYLQLLPEALEEAKKSLDSLRKLTSDNPVEHRNLQALAPLIDEKFDYAQKIVEARRRGGAAAAGRLLIERATRKDPVTWRSVIQDMQNEERRLLKIRTIEAESAASMTKATVAVAALLGCVVVALALDLSR